jgi:glycosyltransferase involved in cell wall biosynthesis
VKTGSAVRVTIGVPFLNNEATLCDAIRSVFAQTFRDWELLLVDDGSTDRSLEIARSVESPRVRLVSDGLHQGLSERLNQIAQAARGKYLARMDSDDMMHPLRIEKQVRYLDTHPGLDLVDTGIYSLDEDGQPSGKRGLKPLKPDPLIFLTSGGIIHPTVTGRTRWFRENPYDGSYERAEDRELWCRIIGRASMGRVPEPLHLYREVFGHKASAYSIGFRSERKVIRKYGPALIGRPRSARLLLRSYLKAGLYRLMGSLGLCRILLCTRNLPLSEHEKRSVRAIIESIMTTSLPCAGLPTAL